MTLIIINNNGGGGADGATWLSGSGVPDVGLGVDGDFYLDTVNGDAYKKVTGAWVLQLNLKGPAGEAGADGATGETGDDGATGPAGPGVPAGGTTGQILTKNSNTDYDSEWSDASGGSADTQAALHFNNNLGHRKQIINVFDGHWDAHPQASKVFGASSWSGSGSATRQQFPSNAFIGHLPVSVNGVSAALTWSSQNVIRPHLGFMNGYVAKLSGRFRLATLTANKDVGFAFGTLPSSFQLNLENSLFGYMALQLNGNTPVGNFWYARFKSEGAASSTFVQGPAIDLLVHTFMIQYVFSATQSMVISIYMDDVLIASQTVVNPASDMAFSMYAQSQLAWTVQRQLILDYIHLEVTAP